MIYEHELTIARQKLREKMPKVFTHDDLVLIAYNWLLNSANCGIAFKELRTASSTEIADAIGFQSGGVSFLVECKVSRNDFFKDKEKKFRQTPAKGMGTYRYYLTPAGIVLPHDLPANWGLIWVNEKGKARKIHYPIIEAVNDSGNKYRSHYKHEKNLKAEHGLLYSALRRLHLRGLVDTIYQPE